MASNKQQAPGWVFGIALLILGLAFSGIGGYTVWEQLRVRNFLPVKGTVTAADIDVESDSDGTSYYPMVTFRYEVDGTVYEAGQLRTVRIGGGQAGAAATVRQYPVGAEVDAWYDPEDPDTAVIETDVSWISWLFAGLGVAMLIGGVLLLIFRKKKRSRVRTAES